MTLRGVARRLTSYAARRIAEHRRISRRRAYVDELKQSGDVDGLLELLAASPAQLDARGNPPLASAELLQAALGRLGYTHVEADAATLEEVRSRCRTCLRHTVCHQWAEGHYDTAEYQAFCPNASALDAFGACRGPAPTTT